MNNLTHRTVFKIKCDPGAQKLPIPVQEHKPQKALHKCKLIFIMKPFALNRECHAVPSPQNKTNGKRIHGNPSQGGSYHGH